ncbi:MAG: hypothetical protein ACTTG8_04990 [Catonella sp.]|uniref:hypothetical protein n=1 Tax=Catonella sp. TaxID=2382125 RepID=UPI003F9F792D
MKVYKDEATGYLFIEDMSDGVAVLSNKRYLEYKSRIKSLLSERDILNSRFEELSKKYNKLSEEPKSLQSLPEGSVAELNTGIAIGMFCKSENVDYALAGFIFEEFKKWYEQYNGSELIAGIRAKHGI